jgi:serine/threonine protein kinase
MKSIEKQVLADSEIAHTFAKRECSVHAKLNHPNIVKVFDVLDTELRYVIFMEYAGVQSNYLVKKIYDKQPIKN